MKTKDIHQSVKFKATPHAVYEMLMDSEQHTQFSGAKAKISREVGGECRAYDGWARATNIELKPDAKIVQTWRGDDWPDHAESLVTIDLVAKNGGTLLSFEQTGVPAGLAKDIEKGWHQYYWDKMKKILEA